MKMACAGGAALHQQPCRQAQRCDSRSGGTVRRVTRSQLQSAHSTLPPHQQGAGQHALHAKARHHSNPAGAGCDRWLHVRFLPQRGSVDGTMMRACCALQQALHSMAQRAAVGKGPAAAPRGDPVMTVLPQQPGNALHEGDGHVGSNRNLTTDQRVCGVPKKEGRERGRRGRGSRGGMRGWVSG